MRHSGNSPSSTSRVTPSPDSTSHPARDSLVFAWCGAAAFVLSLLYFLYAYLIRYSTAASAVAAPRAVITNVALFTAFALHHSVFARPRVKAWLSARVGAMERSVYTWIASVLFFLVCALWAFVPGELYAMPGIFAVPGYTAQALGLIVTVRSSARLDVLDLAGVRSVMQARRGEQPAHVPLETNGLYGFVRHPLYFGWLLFVFGTPHMTMTRLVFALISSGYLAIAIPFEERSLIRTFGQAYREYQHRVRWRMIPGVY